MTVGQGIDANFEILFFQAKPSCVNMLEDLSHFYITKCAVIGQLVFSLVLLSK